VARAATPAQKQGESITTTFDGKSLLIGSEGKRSEVLRIDIPAALDAAPTSSASPPTSSPRPSDTASPSRTGAEPLPSGEDTAAAEDDVPEDPGASGSSRQGTLAALGLAAAIAIVAGSVVALIRRP
jgi:hypothetical protein